MNDRTKKSSALFTPSGCLTGDALMLYVSGSLKNTELVLAKQHLAECPLCTDAADGLRLWLAEEKSGAAGTPKEEGAPVIRLTGEQSLESRTDATAYKPLNKFHVRTDILNQRIKQRLHAHALIEANENKRLSYKPFVWLAAAATIVLFIGSFYVVWMQTQSDRQKLAMQAAEMERASHIEDSLLKAITDTADIYILALNRKSRTNKSLRFNIPVQVDIASDTDILNQDELAETKSVLGEAAENEIAYATKDEKSASPEKNDTNQPTELGGVVVSADRMVQNKVSMGATVLSEEAVPMISGVKVGKSKRSSKPDKETNASVFTVVEEMPSFPGGEAERNKFLAQNIVYPPLAAENGIQGTVYVQFVVDIKGNIKDAKVLRGIGGGCDEEALRVVKMMPKWKPGRQNNKVVNVLYNMSVSFLLQK
jgi:TonB family protein